MKWRKSYRKPLYTVSTERQKNVDKTKGLIQNYFVKKEPPVLRHGPGLSLDFENALRRSSIETPRYEFKQGLLRLDESRTLDDDLLERLISTICGIANVGPQAKGFIFIGVADKRQDADKVKLLDTVEPFEINKHYVVGIDRELKHLGFSLEDYLNKLLGKIRSSRLSEPLQSQVLSGVDVVQYRGFSVIQLTIHPQKQPSFVGDKIFTREGSNTIEASGPKSFAVYQRF